MRSFEDNFGWLAKYDDRVKISVVVATWATRGGKMFGALGGLNRMRGLFPNGVLEALPSSWASAHIFDHLPGLRERASERATNARVTADMIAAVLPTAVVHVEEPLRFAWFENRQSREGVPSGPDPFSMSMLYKVWQADLLRKNLESGQGYPFDVVIRARPDFRFEPPSAEFLHTVADGDIYVDRFSHDKGDVGDGFALGNSATMDVYGQFFMIAYRKAIEKKWKYVHNDLYDHLIYSDLNLKQYSMFGYSPDRLVGLDDVISSVARNPTVCPRPKDGYLLEGQEDADLIAVGLGMAALLARGEMRTDDPRLLSHVVTRLAHFRPSRDGGFLHVLANRLREEGAFETALLYTALSVEEYSDGVIRPELRDVYVGDFAIALRALATAAGSTVNYINPAELLEYCIKKSDSPCALAKYIVAFLEPMSNRNPAIAGLACILAALVGEAGQLSWFIDLHEQRDDLTGAERIVRAGLHASPQSALFHARLALLTALQDDHVAAATEAAVAGASSDPWSVFLAGKALLRIGDFEGAEKLFRHAILLLPSDPDYYMELSVSLLQLGRKSEAIDAAREAATRSPEPMAHRHNHLGNILLACGMALEAESAFRECVRRAPSWDAVWIQLSATIGGLGRYIEAAEIALDLAERRPDAPDLLTRVNGWLVQAGMSADVERLQVRLAAVRSRMPGPC